MKCKIRKIILYLVLPFCLGLISCATLDPCGYYPGKNDDKAIETCSKAISRYATVPYLYGPSGANFYNNRGAAYLNKGLTDLAMKDLNIATEIAPDFSLPYFNRGLIYHRLRRYDLAMAEFDKAIKFDSKFSDSTKYNTYGNDIIRALLMELVKSDSPIHLSVIIGAVNNAHNIPNIDQWKEGIKTSLLGAQERYYAETFKNDPKFLLVSREKSERILTEQKYQNLGLTSSSIEIGRLLGATHLLIIDFARYPSEGQSKFLDVETNTLLEVKSGRVIASQVFQKHGP